MSFITALSRRGITEIPNRTALIDLVLFLAQRRQQT
jgi:hypothetical protein